MALLNSIPNSCPAIPPGRFRRRPRSVARLRALALLTVLLLPLFAGRTAGQSVGETEAKAAFLSNFAKFVEWPAASFATSGAPLVIEVVGDASMAAALRRVVGGKHLQGRPVVILQTSRFGDSVSGHILFVSSSERSAIVQILAAARGAGVLTVSEVEGFAQRGGVINLLVSGNRLAFEINNRSARDNGLRISSKLLTLARTVWE